MGSVKKVVPGKGGIKITVLAEELNVDPRAVVAEAQAMGMENAKVPGSWVTHGQAERLRPKFGGHKILKAQLERRQRYIESGILEEAATPAEPKPAVKPVEVKLGKKTFERDRRNIFSVVQPASGTPPQTPAPSATSVQTVNPGNLAPSTSATSAPQLEECHAVSANLVAPLPAPKKFIGVQLAPPVRRAEEAANKFGVVTPAPEAKPAAGSGMWDKLNDGRPAIDLVAATPEKPPVATAPDVAAPKETAAPVAAPQAAPVAKEQLAPAEVQPPETYEYTPPKTLNDDVPIKRVPEHRAFGAKVNVKAKKLKLVEKDSPRKPAQKDHREHQKPAAKQPAQHQKPPEKVGLLKRLTSIFKK